MVDVNQNAFLDLKRDMHISKCSRRSSSKRIARSRLGRKGDSSSFIRVNLPRHRYVFDDDALFTVVSAQSSTLDQVIY